MSAISYHNVGEQLRTILAAGLSGIPVYLEQNPLVGIADTGKAVTVVMERRAPTPGQQISAGRRTRYKVYFSVWAVGYSINSFSEACQLRDELIDQIEATLMANRTISNTVSFLALEGGDFTSAMNADGQPFCSLGSTIVVAEASATI